MRVVLRTAEQAHDSLTDQATSATDALEQASLGRGYAGTAVFLRHLGYTLGDHRFVDMSIKAANRSTHLVGTVSSLRWGLFGGMSGVGWALNDASTGGRSEVGEQSCQTVDRLLSQVLQWPSWYGNADLIDGLAGIAIYLLDRHRSSCDALLSPIVDHLTDCAVEVGDGIAWLWPAANLGTEKTPSRVDLGVAHGLAGIVCVLARIVERLGPAEQVRAQHLLSQGLATLHRYSGSVGVNEGPGAIPTRGARISKVAWCYGDFGQAAALAAADALVAQGPMDGWARQAAARLGRQERVRMTTAAADVGLCHGTSGVAHVCARLFNRLGSETMRDAAIRWYEETVLRLEAGSGSMGFLEGDVGAALALLAPCYGEVPTWDSVLGLS